MTAGIVAMDRKSGIDAKAKLGMLTVYSVSIFFVRTWVGIAAFTVLLLAAAVASKVSLVRMARLCVPVYVICALTIFFNIFQFHDGMVSPTWEGAVRGCFFSARILLLVLASLVLCLTVSPTRLTRAFCSMMRPLAHLRVPVDDIATVLSISLRFIPVVHDEFFRIRDAQWSRGASFDEGSLFARLRSYCSIFVPLIASLFISAERLAKAMDIRAYGLSPSPRTDIRQSKMDAPSWVLLAVSTVVMIVVAVLV